ncbi:MAG: hypothetical protein M3P49_01420 [Actinomycetota bacterium]|nr:hypothetical protein [Actinomycetota bacterium]
MSEPRKLTRKEANELFDRQARKYCGMSGAKFARKWDAGEFGDPDDRRVNGPGVMRVGMLRPLWTKGEVGGERDG